MKIKSAKKASATKAVVKAAKSKACAAKTGKKESAAAKKETAKSVAFTVHADQGKAVYLAGEFNEWSPTAQKMDYKAEDGVYAATVRLAPGTYQYKFVIDGTWCADPENTRSVPNDQGTFNSVITVD